MHFTFSFALSSRFAQIRISTFRKVVRQHTEGVVGSIIWLLLEIWFSCWKFGFQQ